jgi:hypothetical protein
MPTDKLLTRVKTFMPCKWPDDLGEGTTTGSYESIPDGDHIS